MINKVAIVDDDTIFQFTTKVKLQKQELAKEVLIYSDGEEILEFLKRSSADECPDVLLLDINMPIVDGWDFLDEFETLDKSYHNRIKIFMLSSSINPDDVKRAASNPLVLDYITKPLRDEDLEKIFRP